MADRLLKALDSIDVNNRARTVKLALTGFAAIGTYYLTSNMWSLLKGFWKYCMVWRLNHKKRYGGGWALITGASDGIGKQYCHELARCGFNIALMARDDAKL